MKKLTSNSTSFSLFLFCFILVISASNVHAQLATNNRTLYLQDGGESNSTRFSNVGGDLFIANTNQNKSVIVNTESVHIGSSSYRGIYKLNVEGNILAGQSLISQKIDGYAVFGHKEMVGPANDFSSVALMQKVTGETYLNSAAGKFVSLRINNDPKLTISPDGHTYFHNILYSDADGTAEKAHYLAGNTVLGSYFPVPGATLTVKGRIHVSDEGASQIKFKNFNSENYKDYLLWVQEGIVTNDVAIAHTDHWPDYVFEKDYKLNTLTELENFIKINGHLPTMPAAKEIEENGFTVSDITKRSIQTIEELTLHIIKQQKQLENQAKLIEILEVRLNSLERK